MTGTNALAKASLMLLTRITQVASILSLLLSTSMLGGGYFAYRYFSSEQFKSKVMNEVMKEVQTILPGQINKKLPSNTGQAIPKKLTYVE